MASGRPWTEFGLLARIGLETGRASAVEICPVRIHGLDAIALGVDPNRGSVEPFFRARYEQLLGAGDAVDPGSSVRLGPFGADGCAPLRALREPSEPPSPR
jgi:hypothetical protein